MFKFKVKKELLENAVNAADIGGGKGYCLGIGGKEGEEKLVLSSSSATRTGNAKVSLEKLEGEPKVVFPSLLLRGAVKSLGKCEADVISVVVSEDSMDLAAGENKIQVPLNASDVVLKLPDSKTDSNIFMLSVDDFCKAVPVAGCGGASKLDNGSNMAGMDCIYIRLFCNEEEELRANLFSFTYTACTGSIAFIPVENGNIGSKEEWYAVERSFLQSVARVVTGQNIAVALTPEYVVLRGVNGIWGCKRVDTMPAKIALTELLRPANEAKFYGAFKKSDMNLALEIATVGTEMNVVRLLSPKEGVIQVISGNNKASCSASQMTGDFGERLYVNMRLRQVMDPLGEDIRYYTMVQTVGKNEMALLHFAYVDGDVQYITMTANCREQSKKEEKKGDKKTEKKKEE